MFKLYQFNGCPYCYKVIKVIENLGLKMHKDYELVESSRNTPGREEVIRLGGQSQVPFLVDGDVQMYESSDIIKYLQKKFS